MMLKIQTYSICEAKKSSKSISSWFLKNKYLPFTQPEFDPESWRNAINEAGSFLRRIQSKLNMKDEQHYRPRNVSNEERIHILDIWPDSLVTLSLEHDTWEKSLKNVFWKKNWKKTFSSFHATMHILNDRRFSLFHNFLFM